MKKALVPLQKLSLPRTAMPDGSGEARSARVAIESYREEARIQRAVDAARRSLPRPSADDADARLADRTASRADQSDLAFALERLRARQPQMAGASLLLMMARGQAGDGKAPPAPTYPLAAVRAPAHAPEKLDSYV